MELWRFMGKFFSSEYTGPAFELFGPAHLAALIFIVLLNLFLFRFRKSDDKTKKYVRWSLAITLWVAELAWQIWNLVTGRWTIQTMLPLNICSILIWLSGFMLIFGNYQIYEFAYFMGIGGGLQYLLTPDLGIYGFPHFRFIQTFISHGLLVTVPIYLTVVEGYRPTWKSLLRVTVGINIYMGIIFIINNTIGSDYLFVNGKPSTPSLLSLLPAWPYYIIFMELIGVATFLLLYLPFILKDRQLRQTPLALP
jgi:hypothetical integral membrane protein (TIGR02206 family)